MTTEGKGLRGLVSIDRENAENPKTDPERAPMTNPLDSLKNAKDRSGSRARCVILTDGTNEEVAKRLSALADPHAIVTRDTGFAGAWLEQSEALDFLERACSWRLPDERPALAQGAVADLPVKLWLEKERVLFLVPAPLAHALEERMVGP